jgi:hypothetical protein
MNKIICIVLFFISGILIYQIFKLACKCSITEGYGEFGRVNLGKCCPKGYKYSTTMKKCVHICDACDPSVYNKLTYKQVVRQNVQVLDPVFSCEEHDASTVHDFDSINRRYTKDGLKSQGNYEGWDMNSDFFTASVPSDTGDEDSTAGVQGAEEGGDETWAGISGDAASGASGKWKSEEQRVAEGDSGQIWEVGEDGVGRAVSRYFDEIPEEYYYTGSDECYSDYDSKGMEPISDCIGQWRLEMDDERFEYIKDNDERYAVPNWRIDITDSEPVETNTIMIQNIINNVGGSDTPVGKLYSDFLSTYSDESISIENEIRTNTNNTLNANRTRFCNSLSSVIIEYNEQNESDEGYGSISNNTELLTSGSNNNYTSICEDNNYDNIETICQQQNLRPSVITEYQNIFCDAQKGIDRTTYPICSNGLDVDPSKSFCQE